MKYIISVAQEGKDGTVAGLVAGYLQNADFVI